MLKVDFHGDFEVVDSPCAVDPLELVVFDKQKTASPPEQSMISLKSRRERKVLQAKC